MFHCFRVSVFQCFSDDSRGLSPRRDHGSDRSRFKEQAEIKCEAPEAGRSRGTGARGKQRADGPADSFRAAKGGIPTEPDGAKARRRGPAAFRGRAYGCPGIRRASPTRRTEADKGGLCVTEAITKPAGGNARGLERERDFQIHNWQTRVIPSPMVSFKMFSRSYFRTTT